MTTPSSYPAELQREARAFLQKHKTCVLGTLAADGEPQGATMTYICDDDFNFYFVTRKESRKHRNLLADPRVSIVVGVDPEAPGTAQAQGKAEVLNEPHFMIHYFEKIVDISAPEWWPLFALEGMDFVFFKVTPTWLRWLNLDAGTYPRTYREGFQQILPRTDIPAHSEAVADGAPLGSQE